VTAHSQQIVLAVKMANVSTVVPVAVKCATMLRTLSVTAKNVAVLLALNVWMTTIFTSASNLALTPQPTPEENAEVVLIWRASLKSTPPSRPSVKTVLLMPTEVACGTLTHA